jgi:putative transposase
MALSQSVLSELLDAFHADEGVDLVRAAVRLVMQELIEVEAFYNPSVKRWSRPFAPSFPGVWQRYIER